MTKLAQGSLDLHSGRSQVDFEFLTSLVADDDMTQSLKTRIQSANTAMEALEIATISNINLATPIATKARNFAIKTLRDAPVEVEVLIVDRAGKIIAREG